MNILQMEYAHYKCKLLLLLLLNSNLCMSLVMRYVCFFLFLTKYKGKKIHASVILKGQRSVFEASNL